MIRHGIRRGTAIGLTLCTLLVSLPILAPSAEALDNTYGAILSETNTGDMNLVPYNNPDVISDLKAVSYTHLTLSTAVRSLLSSLTFIWVKMSKREAG